METSPILSIINEIRKDKRFRTLFEPQSSPLYGYFCDCDDVDRKIYIRAEVHSDSLDAGSDLTDIAYYYVERHGVIPGDVPVQIIDKRLGGPENLSNVVPWNKTIDLSPWKDNEKVIYEHVKQGGNRYALMLFAFDYNDESTTEFARPIKIYFHFVLYENSKAVGEPIEGVIENKSPKSCN